MAHKAGLGYTPRVDRLLSSELQEVNPAWLVGKREREKTEQKYVAVLGESVLQNQVIRHSEL